MNLVIDHDIYHCNKGNSVIKRGTSEDHVHDDQEPGVIWTKLSTDQSQHFKPERARTYQGLWRWIH